MSAGHTGAHRPILLGLGLGAVAGLVVHGSASLRPFSQTLIHHVTAPLGQLFLSLLLMLVVPLVFSSLITGVAGIGDLRRLGRVGLRSFGLSLVLSAVSVLIGLGLSHALAPGTHLDASSASALQSAYGADAGKQLAKAAPLADPGAPLAQAIEAIVPRNPLASVAQPVPNMLHLMFFALALGVGATLLPRARADALLAPLESLYEITAALIGLVMRLAPYAVFCLVFYNVAQFGSSLLASLGWFVGTVLLGLGLQLFGVYSLLVRFGAGLSPVFFFRAIRTAMLTAFSTSSSSATLPISTALMRSLGRLPRQIGMQGLPRGVYPQSDAHEASSGL